MMMVWIMKGIAMEERVRVWEKKRGFEYLERRERRDERRIKER